MALRIIVVLILACAALHGQPSIEQGWKGLRLYKNSRADVERVLKQKGEKLEPGFTVYRTEEWNVLVRYWEKPCVERKTALGRYKIQPGTLIDLEVGFFKPTVPISELKWEKSKYEAAPDPHYLDVIHYFNSVDRVWVTTNIENGTELFKSMHHLEFPAIEPDQPCK
jgi:hypothetical protein